MPFESLENKDQYASLKQEFLSGALSPELLKEKLVALDQSTPSREHAYQNLEFLNDPQIESWFDRHEEYKTTYEAFVSFTEFHVGQAEALLSTNTTNALEHFKRALEKAEQSSPWALYIEATIAYLENNIELLKKNAEALPEGKNKEVVSRFINGLAERGNADYSIDY